MRKPPHGAVAAYQCNYRENDDDYPCNLSLAVSRICPRRMVGNAMNGYAKIRERHRYGGYAKQGLRHEWIEFQLVAGGKIISRHETLEQAERALRALQDGER